MTPTIIILLAFIAILALYCLHLQEEKRSLQAELRNYKNLYHTSRRQLLEEREEKHRLINRLQKYGRGME